MAAAGTSFRKMRRLFAPAHEMVRFAKSAEVACFIKARVTPRWGALRSAKSPAVGSFRKTDHSPGRHETPQSRNGTKELNFRPQRLTTQAATAPLRLAPK